METDQSIKSDYAFLIIIVLGVFLIMIFSSPIFYPIPERDSGVFQYIGNQLLHGGVLYKSVWDHKPPMIYAINVISILLGDHSLWGIWLLECFAILISSIMCFRILRKNFIEFIAIICCLMLLGQILLLIDNANYTEVFALPLQFSALSLISKFRFNNKETYKLSLFGVIGGLVFLLKQNLIGIWMAGIIFLCTIRENSKYFIHIGRLITVIIGGFIVFIPFIFYFLSTNSLSNFFDLAVIYNFVYSTTIPDINKRILAIILAWFGLLRSGIGLTGILGWLLCFAFMIVKKVKTQLLFTIAIIDLPFEIILSGISGRQYPHYYIAWLPAITILSAFFLNSLVNLVKKKRTSISLLNNPIGFIGLAFISVIPSIVFFPTRSKGPTEISMPSHTQYKEASDYIQNKTTDKDNVLFWGAETGLLFINNRVSKTRFVYQYPLFTKGYQSEKIIEEFLQDIQENPPILIIDAWKGTDKIPPLNPDERKGWINKWYPYYDSLPKIQIVYEYIYNNYSIVDKIGPQQWSVYKLIN